MPRVDLTDDEVDVLTALVLSAFQGARDPDSEHNKKLRRILAKLAPEISEAGVSLLASEAEQINRPIRRPVGVLLPGSSNVRTLPPLPLEPGGRPRYSNSAKRSRRR
jgi:hypothetical protein